MCRILAFNSNKFDAKSVALQFRKLAHTGKTLKSDNSGHKDGWGILAFKNEKKVLFKKSFKDALQDEIYSKTVNAIIKNKSDLTIIHLRKASVGKNKIKNTHPFLYKNFGFCHNGTIFDSEKLPLNSKFKKLVKGDTDSEKLFLYIIQIFSQQKGKTSQDMKTAIKKALDFVRSNLDYMALNFILSDGNFIWAFRGFNKESKIAPYKNLKNYYTLYSGEDKLIISSEKVDSKTKWEEFKNNELREYNIKSHKKRIFKI